MSDEPFMQDLPWLSDLKLRGSWGVTGNNDIGNYRSLSILNPANYILGGSFSSGQVLGAFANSELGWEQSNQINIGLDAALIRNRLYFTAEYYRKVTNDMLLPIEIPVISGFTTTFSNIGEVENQGLEFALGYQTSINKVNLYADFNIAFNRNKVLEINGENNEIRDGSMYSVYNVSRIGRPIGMLHGFRMVGIFNTQEEIDAWRNKTGPFLVFTSMKTPTMMAQSPMKPRTWWQSATHIPHSSWDLQGGVITKTKREERSVRQGRIR